ncbi:hypothetical protein VAE151_630730 [Vibrio aestuarianus]|uniref:Uncharacterized protein n=1 Tax=Vibrio aestuarianus TaxID=28171 RepID=A0ABM9FJ77_9VIBR|nr:hypothetical protein VAE063_1010202 [Vibrio aestuarianus]CAH8224274.1 hypothetical protein VAE308_1270080 [Vibrio aestuarianus]CAH8228965.1 hypothetical protein VAE128_500723 [Vibrio aestuarianus]CAH8229534.1 hypothetical protein VAE130_600729 [Vibrio aestuarianus]CAH8237999.1 hypothetical protein VAE016_410729 [Vibrio aestuarianus]
MFAIIIAIYQIIDKIVNSRLDKCGQVAFPLVCVHCYILCMILNLMPADKGYIDFGF